MAPSNDRRKKPSLDGRIPTFPFRDRFSLALLRQLSMRDYESAFLEFVPRSLREGRDLPLALLEYFALSDWLADTNNGGLDQYFSRRCDWLTATIDRAELYPRVRTVLQRLGLASAASLFEEAIARYSDLHQPVDEARVSMGIAKTRKWFRSNIMRRYHRMLEDIEFRQWEYFGQNLSEFAVE